MSLISFLKDAGEKLFHPSKNAASATTATAAAPSSSPDIPALEKTAAEAILNYIRSQNLDADDLNVAFDAASQTVVVSGAAADQETKEKIVLCCGNVQSVEHVDDQLTVKQAEAKESQWRNVQPGDTLSKIAKECYGDANKYNVIFEANKPMLSSADKIYPGQKLRIPEIS